MFNLIGFLIIGAIAGWGASRVMGTSKEQGLLMDIVLGVVGSYVGGIVFEILPLPGGRIALVPAFVGAVIVLFVWKRVIKKD
ncbi:MAG: GlsB/YeaQ/YmgE family stress response membrane protein [Phototrophicaceae bacterium]